MSAAKTPDKLLLPVKLITVVPLYARSTALTPESDTALGVMVPLAVCSVTL